MEANFQKRRIKITFKLMAGSFQDGTDTLTIDYAKATINYENYANCFAALPRIMLRVYGLHLETLKRLVVTKIEALAVEAKNRVQVHVSDGAGNMVLIFDGQILAASVNFNIMPSAPLIIEAYNCGEKIADRTPPLAYKGDVRISQVLQDVINGQMGLSFHDGGIDAIGHNVSLNGSSIQKLRNLARDYRLSVFFHNDTVSVAPTGNPNGLSRAIFDVNIGTGLIGFPTLTEYGATCSMLYNPALMIGDKIKLDSVLNDVLNKNRSPGLANGEWFVNGINAELESETPEGSWLMHLKLHSLTTQGVD